MVVSLMTRYRISLFDPACKNLIYFSHFSLFESEPVLSEGGRGSTMGLMLLQMARC